MRAPRQVTYEALQDAGLSMERMRGLDIGVFAGVGLPEFPIRNGSEPGAVGSVTGTYGCARRPRARRCPQPPGRSARVAWVGGGVSFAALPSLREPIFLVPFDFNSSNLDYEVRMAGAVLGVNRLFSSAHLDTVDPRPSPSSCFVANRVSHFFDFTGPSVAIDTACSSSLTALHLAANSLRAGDCCAAVVIGERARAWLIRCCEHRLTEVARLLRLGFQELPLAAGFEYWPGTTPAGRKQSAAEAAQNAAAHLLVLGAHPQTATKGRARCSPATSS
jgi:hypothetical protein